MSAATLKVFTVEEYLAWEPQQEGRFEFHNGMILAMAGGTTPHALICENALVSLAVALKGTACRARGTEQKVHAGVCGNYYYPDTTVVCGRPHYNEIGSLLNPVLVVEVLSSSTHLFDRNAKFECYQTLDSLQTYILIAQDNPRVEVFTRDESGEWLSEPSQILTDLSETVELENPKVRLLVSDLYADVFPQ